MSMPIEMITDQETEGELERAGFYWRERAGVVALVCRALEQDGFTNGFSTRLGGVSPMPDGALNLAGFIDDTSENIYENRRRFLKLLGGDWTLATSWQTHGAEIRSVTSESEARSDEMRCDAQTTCMPGVLLGAKTADCVPVLLGDWRTGAGAAVHAGWRGTSASIVQRALERMRQQFDTRIQDVRAAIGPCARVCCYEVGNEVIEIFRARFKDADELFVPTRVGHARIDLQRANFNQLIEAGVSPQRIHVAPLCTMDRNELFFSYRQEKHVRGRVGRLLAVIGRQSK